MPAPAPVRLLFFASVRERAGTAEASLVLPPGIDRVDRLVAHLSALNTDYRAALATPRTLRCAVNQELAATTAPVAPGDEVAFFPPMTGG